MQHITGTSRHQMRISSLEDAIAPDNQIRFINAFVGFVDLAKLGFTVQTLKKRRTPELPHASVSKNLFIRLSKRHKKFSKTRKRVP